MQEERRLRRETEEHQDLPKATSKSQARPTGRKAVAGSELTEHKGASQKSLTLGAETAKQTKQDSLFEVERAPDRVISDLELYAAK